MSALFTPTSEWQDVPPDAVLPPGLEYELNMETGTQRARLPQNGHAPLDDLDRDYAEQEATANGGATQTATSWPEPVDIIGAPEMVGWPDLTRDCLPALLYTYVTSEAERLNVDVCAVRSRVGGGLLGLQRRMAREAEASRLLDTAAPPMGLRGQGCWPAGHRDDPLRILACRQDRG
jgi:hypothetical protein